MKKGIILISLFVTGIIACSRKIIPAIDETSATRPVTVPVANIQPVTDKTKTEETPSQKEKGDTKPTSVETGVLDLTVMLGASVFTTKCGKCHALKNTSDYTASRWDGILNTMIPNAKLNNEEAKQVTAYIKANCKK